MIPKKPTLHPDRSFLTLGEPGRDAAPIESRAQVSCEELEQFCSQRRPGGVTRGGGVQPVPTHPKQPVPSSRPHAKTLRDKEEAIKEVR